MKVKYEQRLTFEEIEYLTLCPNGSGNPVGSRECLRCNFIGGKAFLSQAVHCNYDYYHAPKTWKYLLGKPCKGERTDTDEEIRGILRINLSQQPLIEEFGSQLARVYPHSLRGITKPKEADL